MKFKIKHDSDKWYKRFAWYPIKIGKYYHWLEFYYTSYDLYDNDSFTRHIPRNDRERKHMGIK
jgi:hypothetical protein